MFTLSAAVGSGTNSVIAEIRIRSTAKLPSGRTSDGVGIFEVRQPATTVNRDTAKNHPEKKNDLIFL
jgi:hypothetical protein